MEYQDLKKLVFETAKDLAERGYGWAQESVVLREVADRLQLGEQLPPQQDMLTAWHDLFLEGKLSWGYDLDTPNAPFFHVPAREAREVNAPAPTTVPTT